MITVTEQAAAKIRDLFAEQGDAKLCLRLSVGKGGCEGYSNSVMGQGFTVSNPNAVSTCGCGHSFKTADDAGAPDPCGDDGRGCS